MTIELLTPLLEGGFQNINFFEGRLLTGRDLREQQAADETKLWNLGRAIGAGVIDGLEVEIVNKGSEAELPVLKVQAGAGLNEKGQILKIESDKDIILTRSLKPSEQATGQFSTCLPPKDSAELSGFGIYILVMSPASGLGEDLAPKIGLEDKGVARDCGHRYALEGVQFRLEELRPSNLSGISDQTRSLFEELLTASDLASLSKLQNLVAHLCFGTEVLAGFAREPFAMENGSSTFKNYGALDDLRELRRLTDCDLPLAILHWKRSGINFLDLWSVRRRPYQLGLSTTWPTLVGQRRLAEAEGIFLQFQAQLEGLIRDHANPASIAAGDYFRYLPAVGLYPVAQAGRRGLGEVSFFAGKPNRGPEFIDGTQINTLINLSFDHSPIDLATAEMVWLFQSWQNRSIEAGAESVQPFIVFSGPNMPNIAMARFDVARWDLSNYGRLIYK